MSDELAGKILGIMLTTSPEKEDGEIVKRIANEALKKGAKVRIFLMCDGVLHIKKGTFGELVPAGADVCICYHNLLERNLNKGDEAFKVTFGSQYDLADILHTCDRFLAFN